MIEKHDRKWFDDRLEMIGYFDSIISEMLEVGKNKFFDDIYNYKKRKKTKRVYGKWNKMLTGEFFYKKLLIKVAKYLGYVIREKKYYEIIKVREVDTKRDSIYD